MGLYKDSIWRTEPQFWVPLSTPGVKKEQDIYDCASERQCCSNMIRGINQRERMTLGAFLINATNSKQSGETFMQIGNCTLGIGSQLVCTNVRSNQTVRVLVLLGLHLGRQCLEHFISFPSDFYAH